MSNLDDDQENGEELAMVHVRNALEVGPGGKQKSNWKTQTATPIELFEPAR
jgi:hypothetical protein